MTELQLYKFVEKNECEWHWNPYGHLIIFISHRCLKDFCTMLGRNAFDDGGLNCEQHLCADGDVAFNEFEFAYKTLNLFNVYKQSLEESFEHLRNIKVSEKELDEILAKVLLSDANLKLYYQGGINHKDISTQGRNTFFGVKQAMEQGVGQEICEAGTAMWALNGITTYFQNSKKYVSDEKKFDSVINGHAANKLQMAYDMLIAV